MSDGNFALTGGEGGQLVHVEGGPWSGMTMMTLGGSHRSGENL